MTKPIKWGSEFVVNTTVMGYQSSAAIVGLTNGRSVVTWSDYSLTGGDTFAYGVRGQILNADGSKSGSEFLVNTTVTGDQFQSTICPLANGRFVVAWTDGSATGGDTSGYAVRAQIFNPDGSLSGPEFLVNTTVSSNQIAPTITGLKSGGFVIAWSDTSLTGGDVSVSAVRSRLFAADGTPLGADFLVNTTTRDIQHEPTVTALSGGGYVVAWTDGSNLGGDNSVWGIKAQIFNDNGTKSGGEFLVNTTRYDNQLDPSITALANGGFVVSWEDYSASQGGVTGFAIRAQVYNATGATVGTEFRVNPVAASAQFDSATAALPDGRFVVVWGDSSGRVDINEAYHIMARVFNADGTATGPGFAVSGINQLYSAVSVLADGRFAVVWDDYNVPGGVSSAADIRAQIFDARTAAVNLAGTQVADDLIGTKFNDTMAGALGNDKLDGGAGNDLLSGDGGNDVIVGGAGSDTITGGAGNDRFNGGAGADVFVFAAGGGRDTVSIFTDGSDKFDLSAYNFASVAAAKANFANVGADCIFTLGADVLVVKGWSLAQIGAGDLIL